VLSKIKKNSPAGIISYSKLIQNQVESWIHPVWMKNNAMVHENQFKFCERNVFAVLAINKWGSHQTLHDPALIAPKRK